MRLGSKEHKHLFCQSFIANHREYEPETLPWPPLDADCLALLQKIPFWQKARDTETHAGVLLSAFAETIDDPVIREAIALQGQEEERHSRLIKTLLERYQIEVTPAKEILLPRNIENAFMNFGFEECLDSFFAFGLFALARQAKIFPEQLYTIFDPILDEEARHIVFFVNWFTYVQIQRGWGFPPLRAMKTLKHYIYVLNSLIDTVAGTKPSQEQKKTGFTATDAKALVGDLTAEKFLATCLRENKQRMSQFDSRLLQPSLLPRLSVIALQVLQLKPKKRQQVSSTLGGA